MIDVYSGNVRQAAHGYSSSGNYVVKARNVGKSLQVSYDSSTYYNRVKNLKSCKIPKTFTSIGDYAFYYCTSLTSINIPDSVNSIGDNAFHYCTSLTSIIVDSGNIIYDSRDNCNAIIKTSINELIVGCKNTIIPDSVITIGDYAFHYCTSLTSINIPDSVITIGDYAFYYCTSLTSINIPDSVNSIGDNAFHYCTSLTSINIPDSVITIGSWAFSYCKSLTSINIPDSVTSIKQGLFFTCESLISVNISDSVTSIGDRAFGDCNNLETINIPKSIKNIFYYTFGNCYKLKDINIPDSVTSIGDDAFKNCQNLTLLTIPKSVNSLGSSVFYNCSSLEIVDCSKHTTIPTCGSNVFYNCKSDFKIIVPKNLYSSWKTASNWSTYADNIYADSYEISDQMITGYSKPQKYTGQPIRPVQIKTIAGSYLVENTDYEIEYFNNVEIGTASFSLSGINLYSGSFSDTFEIAQIQNTMLTIDPSKYYSKKINVYSAIKKSDSESITIDWGDGTSETLTANISNKSHTYSDSTIRKLTFSDDATTIGFGYSTNYAGNAMITNIDSFGSNISCLTSYAFYYAKNLTSVDLSKSNISALYSNSFSYMTNLTSFNIGSSLTSTSTYFLAYSGISSIYIPKQLTSIGQYAFRGCEQLTLISVDEDNPKYDSRDNCNGIVTTSTNTLFRACMNTTIPNSVSAFGLRCYSRLPITEFTMPSHISVFGMTMSNGYVFQYCEDLTSVTLHDNVTELGTYTFHHCESLPRIFIPPQVSTIRAYCFGFCYQLNYISFARHTTVPGLASVYAFKEIDENYKIIVPAALYSTWITASNWSSIASHIVALDNTMSNCYVEYLQEVIMRSSDPVEQTNLKVYSGDTLLIKDTDYTVSYSNNTSPGTATMTITGIGNYTGTTSREFTICYSYFLLQNETYYPEDTYGKMTIKKQSDELYESYFDWSTCSLSDTYGPNSSYSNFKVEKTNGHWYITDIYFETNASSQKENEETSLSSEVEESELFSGNFITSLDTAQDTTYKIKYLS